MTTGQQLNPMTTHGMVTSPHYLASQAGLELLRNGGTAVDAAIAAAATLAVVYPQMCTLGGDGFWLIYNAKKRKLEGLNASGRAGAKASIDFYAARGLKRIPPHGYLAANTVPGVVSGWEAAYNYAQRELDSPCRWGDLFAAAVMYAEEGFPVSASLAFWSRINTATDDTEFRALQRFPEFSAAYLDHGSASDEGTLLRLPDLARTLKTLASHGAEEFYQGDIAARIVADLEKNGGVLSREDFARHTADWVEPLSVSYRGHTACNLPPNTQGMASLEILNICNRFDMRALGEGTADYCHLIIEATKLAFADRDAYLSDPAFADIPVGELLSDAHADRQASRISMNRAAADVRPMDPHGDTAWLGVVDRWGNAVSLIQSIYHDFGSAIVPGGTGILLQNRGSYFSLDPGHVNCLQPGKRTLHTLNPAMLFKGGRPFLVYGTMGGEGQPQTQAALVTRIVDFGMTPQAAIDAPRWLYGRSWGREANDLKLEGRFPAAVVEELLRRGHPASLVAAYTDIMGHAGAILINQESGIFQGGADPRGDGLACGY